MRGTRRLGAAALAGASALVVTGCGGGERQDADEPSGSYRLEVVSASFPTRQSLADATELKIVVRNADRKAAPNVAVTVGTEAGSAGTGAGAGGVSNQAFSYSAQRTDLADRTRPAWILDESPEGGDTAYTNTWSLGRLAPGKTKRFVWKLTAVKPGTYTINYSVSPGLTGKATAAGGDTKGSFRVRISDEAPDARVDDAGNVVRGSGAEEAN